MAAPTWELAAIGLARWLESSRAFCGAVPLVPQGGHALCVALLVRGLLSTLEAVGITEVFYPSVRVEAWGLGQELAFAAGAMDIVMCMVGFAGLGGKNVYHLKNMCIWLLVRIGLGLVWVTLFFVEQDIGRGARLLQRLLAAAALLAVDLELLWTGARLVLAATLHWTLAPTLNALICKAQGVALARRDDHCEKRHFLVAVLADYESSRMLEVAHADVALMRAELASSCDMLADYQSRGFLDAVPLGADLEAALHAALHLQAQGGDDKLRVDHVLTALSSTGEIRVQLARGGVLQLAGVARYRVDARAMAEQAAAVRGHLQAVAALRAPGQGDESVPTVFGALRLPLEETVLAYSVLRALAGAVSMLGLCLGMGAVPRLLAGGKVTPHESKVLEWLVSMWAFSFNVLGIRAMVRNRTTRKAVQAAAAERGAVGSEGLHKAFDFVREHTSADAWLTAFRLSAAQMGFLLVWGPAELLLEMPILGLGLVRADVCRVYAAGIARVASARLVPLAAQVPLHCTGTDVAVLATVVAYLALKLYMCWAVVALWHQYAFGWTTTDLRGAAYLAINPFQPAFGFGERQKLIA